MIQWRRLLVAVIAALMLASSPQARASVVINELMASNGQAAKDPQGQFDDWIELHNLSDATADIGGMYLTDDLENPTKWRIPAGVTIAAKGHLLIWADNDTADEGLHAAFSLSASGEEVGLYDRDGMTLVDSVTFGEQPVDVSYGRFPDGTDDWAPMGYSTPGQENRRGYEGIVERPQFSRERGFYDAPFYVTLTCPTADAQIYYTTDGSDPYGADRGSTHATGVPYREPLRISRTTCLRAVATRTGWRASAVETHTYLFIEDVITQSPNREPPGPGWPSGGVNGQMIDYGVDPDVVNDPRYKDLMDDALTAIPSISLVTDLDHLFGAQNGIYVNARAQGRNWERPVSVELLNPDGRKGFQIDAGLRIRGGYSRSGSNPKHAFRLFFRAEYGPSKLNFPLFGEEGVDEYDAVDLRTSQNYSWSYEGGNSNSHDTFVREVFSRDTQRDMDQPYTRSRYYHLYIDGHCWGLFQTQERSEASYAETYFGADKEDYDVIKSRAGNGGYDIEATDGTLDAWRRLWEAARSGFNNDQTYYRVQGLNPNGTVNPEYEKLLDIYNLIDYMLCTYYVGDPDGPVSAWARVANNFYGVYNRVNPDGFKFFRHDAEHSLDNLNESRLFASSTTAVGERFNQSNPLWMHIQLMEHPEYRTRFADRIYRHFFNDGVLTPQACADRFMARAEQIDLAIIAESARWGDAKRSRPRTRDDDWLPDINGMVDSYFPARTNVVMNQFRTQGWYPTVVPPQFEVAGQPRYGGWIDESDRVAMSAAAGEIWYTTDGSDPRVPGTAGGAGTEVPLVAEEAPKWAMVPTGAIDDAWRVDVDFDVSDWVSGTGGVGYERSTGYEQFFEIDVRDAMYAVNQSCYVRIPFELSEADFNDVSSLALKARYDDGFVAYINGVEACRVMFNGEPVWNSGAMGNHSDLDAIEMEPFDASPAVGALRAGTNILAIHGLNAGATSSDFLISVTLTGIKGVVGGTPGGVSAGALRYSEPLSFDKSTPVKARTLNGTTWSALADVIFAVGPVAEGLRISEVMYHPVDPDAEYVELTNVGVETLNLNLVRLTEGIDLTFPDIKLEPGQYVLAVKDRVAFESLYGPGLPVAGQYEGSLSNAGERIELQDAAGQVIHSVRYRDGWYDITDGQGFSLTVKSPATTDADSLDEKSSWRPSAEIGGSPGYDDTGIVPELGAVVINEILANPTGGASDWIELHNTTDGRVDVGGWFLSDDADELTRYEIATGTTIARRGYLLLRAQETFGNVNDPGCQTPFGLSRNGETLHLHSGDRGVLTGYSVQKKFDASADGVSMGRHRKSTGSYNFVPMSTATPGAANASPMVGPVVINEIMYHPMVLPEAEYVELLNVSDGPVTLYDEGIGVSWRFSDDPGNPPIECPMPTDEPLTLQPGQCVLLIKDLIGFTVAYGYPADIPFVEWGAGGLSDSTEKIELVRPGGDDVWLRVDRVVYSNGSQAEEFASGIDPWPLGTAGQGLSLHRIDPMAYGNDPSNWKAAPPTPGRTD